MQVWGVGWGCLVKLYSDMVGKYVRFLHTHAALSCGMTIVLGDLL